MRHSTPLKIIMISAALLSLAACGKGEVKTGSLVQRFAMVDNEGRHFGMVEMDPVSGSTIYDTQGRVVGRVMPPAATGGAATAALGPLPGM